MINNRSNKSYLAVKAALLLGCLYVLLLGCREDNALNDTKINKPVMLCNSGKSQLTFHVKLNREIYQLSDYGEAPQLAIWLESEDGKEIRTVFVTYRTAKAKWKGKVECPVSLSFWVGRWNKETATIGEPTAKNPVIDAVTGATPKDELTVKASVPAGSKWNCFAEVNVASDFSIEYPFYVNGMPDPQMNGQPSAIFKGSITAIEGKSVRPVLVGRTKQVNPSTAIIEEVKSLTTIKDIFIVFEVKCERLK